ncbi:hypothetical protein ACFVH6_00125 [Spirillospora sp. NPDC127200]
MGGAVLGAALVLGGAGIAVERAGQATTESAGPATKTSAAPAPAGAPTTPPEPTAQQVATRLAATHRLPNPRETTPKCVKRGCRQLITTDRVTIAEFLTVEKARAYQRSVKDPADVKRVGRYTLSFSGREAPNVVPPAERRQMAAALKRMLL